MFIPFNHERLAEMSKLASYRQLECDRLTGERVAVQVYKVSSYSRPGFYHTVILRDEEAECTCPAKEACSHIALALSDWRPRLISEWAAADHAKHLGDVLEVERAASRGTLRGNAKRLVEEHRARRRTLLAPKAEPEALPTF